MRKYSKSNKGFSVETRGLRNGTCNICGEVGPLTEDHTPPKGCVRPTEVELLHITHALSASVPKVKRSFSQNGVKYRTLCGRCNNKLLGHTYDPYLIAFANGTAALLQSSLYLPSFLEVPARPQAIMRSVLGHIAAQGVDRYKKGPHTEEVRDYILDLSKPLPQALSMYYWAYPHKRQVLVRDASYMDLGRQKPFLAWFIKFFPLAFLVAWDASPTLPFPVQSLNPWRNSTFNMETELPLSLRSLPPEEWPEAPTAYSALLYGREAIVAHTASTKKKK